MDKLTAQILELAPCDISQVLYVLIYGSYVHGRKAPRDIDALLICKPDELKVINSAFDGIPLHLHIVNQFSVDLDIYQDKFGWILLIKYLDQFYIPFGDANLAKQTKARAYLRLFGQWAKENHTFHFSSYETICKAVYDVLKRWNPQFEMYVKSGRIDPQRFDNFVLNDLPLHEEFKSVIEVLQQGFKVKKSSPLVRHADLRVLLIRYWSQYLFSLHNPQLYLSEYVDQLLTEKEITCSDIKP